MRLKRIAVLLPQISSNSVTSIPHIKINVVNLEICIINISTLVPTGVTERGSPGLVTARPHLILIIYELRRHH